MQLLVPGKVMLSGEYAVLEGASATLLPLPRYMQLSVATEAPVEGYTPVVERGRSYFMNACENHEHAHGVPHVAIERSAFDAADPQGRPRKLGIGSSAAEAAGVLGLRLLNAGVSINGREAEFLEDVLELHKRAQGGLGSGADCAVCAIGRPLLFSGGEGIRVRLLPQGHDDVPLNLVWSGEPANSRELIDKFQFWRQNDPQSNALMKELSECAGYLGESWFHSSADELFGLVDAHNAIMKEVSKLAGISYYMPVHTLLETWARRHGGRSKPTGAGGGDMVLMLGELPLEQLQRVCIPLKTDELYSLTTIAAQLETEHLRRSAAEAAAAETAALETDNAAGDLPADD